MSKNTGGSAYPSTGMDGEYFHFSRTEADPKNWCFPNDAFRELWESNNTKQDQWERGNEDMTLRDWFAGQALIGILTNTGYDHNEPHIIAERAYQMTDAMLAERSK